MPGIDFSNDPLLHGSIHSYLDTQISRLGGRCPSIPAIFTATAGPRCWEVRVLHLHANAMAQWAHGLANLHPEIHQIV
ncbi:hypothetical protein B0E41_19570 [Hydrogenophaga sp. A37]|nr:hypothetical protein B0E41_19570 [Hydrogenophaga sp. A37]